ncbi:hypothetical protein [Streptomyces sp. TLI_55]|uniref:hypothetical protein n=1 Tax=Streptomyces sp. TLI_55 TaxID=1938861 RepID=UPI0015CF1658|nr:hypothetical protein [Streptomyces sp. TLI_55]
MTPAAGALWPELAYADPEPDTDTDTDQESYGISGHLNTSYNRLNTPAQAYSHRAPA